MTFEEDYSSSPDFAESYVRYYPPGKEVIVYFDRSDPRISVLEITGGEDFAVDWVFLILSILGFLLYGGLALKDKLSAKMRAGSKRLSDGTFQ